MLRGHVPDDLLVPPILNELNAAGVPDSDVSVMVGIGMHRPATPSEMSEKLGADVVGRVKVVNPTPGDPSSLIDLGMVAHGVPCRVNRRVYEADLSVATGVVEPHQYAGYSGGRKTVAIGCSSAATIQYSHGPAMLDHPKVRLAQLEGNPFHEAITEIAERVGLTFVLNVVADEEHRLVAVEAGSPDTVSGRAGAGRLADVYGPDRRTVRHRSRRRWVSEGLQFLSGIEGSELPAVRTRSGGPVGRRNHHSGAGRGRRGPGGRASKPTSTQCARPSARQI